MLGAHTDMTVQKQAEQELRKANANLRKALNEIKTLRGIIPICAKCHKIRDEKGYWDRVESYISRHTKALFSHGLCPVCYKQTIKEVDRLPHHKPHPPTGDPKAAESGY